MKLEDSINKRCSCREYKKKEVKWADIIEAIDAASRAPLAGNINNLHFVIISKLETRDKIAQQCQQHWMSEAPYIIVICSDPTRLERMYSERSEKYCKQHSGAAIQNFLLRITDLGLSSCWVGAFHDELIKQMLKIPGHINIEAILPVGYARYKPKQKTKARIETLINWEVWGQKRKPVRSKDPATW